MQPLREAEAAPRTQAEVEVSSDTQAETEAERVLAETGVQIGEIYRLTLQDPDNQSKTVQDTLTILGVKANTNNVLCIEVEVIRSDGVQFTNLRNPDFIKKAVADGRMIRVEKSAALEAVQEDERIARLRALITNAESRFDVNEPYGSTQRQACEAATQVAHQLLEDKTIQINERYFRVQEVTSSSVQMVNRTPTIKFNVDVLDGSRLESHSLTAEEIFGAIAKSNRPLRP